MRQADLFGAARGPAAPPPPEIPEPDAIRARLRALLETVCAAREMPWEPPRARAQEHLFHNMANWLPETERDSLRQAFATELDRLRHAQAQA